MPKKPPVKKYLVEPGYIISEIDYQEHYVSVHDLMHLYEVDPRECVIDLPFVRNRGHIISKLTKLSPRSDGKYKPA